jgi:hypothetical protein
MNMVCNWLFLVVKIVGFKVNSIEKWLVVYTFTVIQTTTMKPKPL